MQTQRGNATWRAKAALCLHFARPSREGVLLPSPNTVSTPVCQTVCLSWNKEPRRRTQGAIEKHIAGKWHIIASQEAIEYLQHECFMNHVYITHFAGCAVLLNKGTFHSDIWVNSVYIHDTRTGQQQVVKESQSGWVLQAVISRASFWRIPRNANSDFTLMSLHINNKYSKKRGIVKNLSLAVRTVMHHDMVAGDFSGAAWRRRSGNEPRRDRTTEEGFVNTNLPIPHVPAAWWRTMWGSRRMVRYVRFHQATWFS